MTASIARRLSRQSPVEGVLTLHTGTRPSLTASLVIPSTFGVPINTLGPQGLRPGSASGLGNGTMYKSFSLVLAGINTALKAELSIAFSELAVHLKLAVEQGLFTGLGFSITGVWSQVNTEVATSVGLNQYGVHLRLEFVLNSSNGITRSDNIVDGFSLLTAWPT
jgi:DnaJ family protein C protein 11